MVKPIICILASIASPCGSFHFNSKQILVAVESINPSNSSGNLMSIILLVEKHWANFQYIILKIAEKLGRLESQD